MDYTRQPISSLVKGPLLHTPQGIVVLLAAMAYFATAIFVGAFGIWPTPGVSQGHVVALCIGWPIILFIYYVKDNQPGFAPSWLGAAWLGICAVAPVVLIAFRL